MTDCARYLYFIGRAPLRPVEQRVAMFGASLFWTGGKRQELGALRPTYLVRQGLGSSPMNVGRALVGLKRAGILVHVERYRFRLVDDPLFWTCWGPDGYERAASEWSQILEPPSRLQLAVVAMLHAVGISTAPHRADPEFAGWLDAVLVLADKYGEPMVAAALAEAARDPLAVYPATPERLPELLYPLVQRHRRNLAHLS